MGEKLLAERPVAVICHIWKCLINSPYCIFGPLALHLLIHVVFQDDLHQSMDSDSGVFLLALDKRIAREGGDGFVQQGFVGGKRL